MRFYIKEKVFSIGDNFSIFDESGNEVFYVKGQVFSLGNKLRIYDERHKELIYMEQKIFSLMPQYTIYGETNALATIRKKVTFLSHKFMIDSIYGDFTVDGDFMAHDFSIIKNGTKRCASIIKKWFSFGDSYEINIADDENIPFMLALVIVIDQVLHDNKN